MNFYQASICASDYVIYNFDSLPLSTFYGLLVIVRVSAPEPSYGPTGGRADERQLGVMLWILNETPFLGTNKKEA